MKYTCEKFPHALKNFCICDAQIDEINCLDNAVRFMFSKGFSVISCGKVKMISRGYIELFNCEAEDFDCHIVRREATASGTRLCGEPVSLIELANILSIEERKIEIFLELYDFNCLHWRGVLLPHKTRGLSDNVVIEARGCFPMTYSWEDRTIGGQGDGLREPE